MNGQALYDACARIIDMPRSLTGPAVRDTLGWIRESLPDLQWHAVPSGTKVWDWTVPAEWLVDGGVLVGPGGVVCDYDDSPLHLVGYSVGASQTLTLEDLRPHLYVGEGVVPYVTSYYAPRWGFCLSDDVPLPAGTYRVGIDARHDEHGQLDYADFVVPGRSADEVLFSTYVCHPAMAVDNTAAIVVQTALAEWIASERRRYTYRFVWCPETIGALCYMWGEIAPGLRRLPHLRDNVVAAFALSCLGHKDGDWSVTHSRSENTLADRLLSNTPSRGSWMARGSDERQYGSPAADLPVVGLASARWGTFSEYHTSADDMGLLTPGSLADALDTLKRIVRILEGNGRFAAVFPGDVDLGRRGLYPTLGHGARDKRYQHVLSYCDGTLDALDIADRTGLAAEWVVEALDELKDHELVEVA